MNSSRHLDVNKAVNNFLQYFERLSRLPLITDDEMHQLFGEDVKLALAELDCYNRQDKLCARCVSRCCLLVDCELYSPDLKTCPIHSYRPLICRMHFCNQFALVYPVLVKEIGDVFLESLLVAESRDKQKAQLLDSPPLGKYIPKLLASVTSLINVFKKGRLDEAPVLKLIQEELDKHYQQNNTSLYEREVRRDFLKDYLRNPH